MPKKLSDFKDDKALQDYLDTLVKDTTEAAEKPLKLSVEGLQKDVTKYKATVKEYGDITPEKAKQTATDLQQLLDKTREGESDAEKALRLASEKHKTDMEAVNKKIDDLVGANQKLKVDDTLRAALVKADILPEMLDMSMSALKGLVTIIKDDKGNEKVTIGDQLISEHVADWILTPVGKRCVKAPLNKGGGGGGGGDHTSSEWAKYFEMKDGAKGAHYNLTKQIQLKRENSTLYDNLVKSFEK